jgi:hypothetical protein
MFSETVVDFQGKTRPYIPEDSTHQMQSLRANIFKGYMPCVAGTVQTTETRVTNRLK